MPPPRPARHERAVSFQDSDRAAWLRLSLTPGVGPASARRLLGAFGPPEQVFAAGFDAVCRVAGPVLAGSLFEPDPGRDRAVDQALQWAGVAGQRLTALGDPDYPARLVETADPPVLLYVRGDPAALARPAVAIVGSRTPTAGGEQTAAAFAQALGDAGLAVVSGLARGIDAAAHRGALAARSGTVAVLGTGVDAVYPAAHRGLADAIADAGGAVVSEMPLGCGPRKASFPRRNRVIAGLSLGVLVVEAALRSGSLITARQAADAGREVFAIPGSIHSPLARGCHQLIRQGAKLVECAADVLEELAPQLSLRLAGTAPGVDRRADAGAGEGAAALQRPARSPTPAGAADPLLERMGWDPVGVDTLVARHAGDSRSVAARLLELELAGRVDRLADGRYQRRA
jgi:DNA processing protein